MRVSSVFDEALFLVQRNRSFVFCNNAQFKLFKACAFCAFDTCVGQGTAYTDPPKLFRNTYPVFGSVTNLAFSANLCYVCNPGNLAVDNSNEQDFPLTCQF